MSNWLKPIYHSFLNSIEYVIDSTYEKTINRKIVLISFLSRKTLYFLWTKACENSNFVVDDYEIYSLL
jgi:hypothetical protein